MEVKMRQAPNMLMLGAIVISACLLLVAVTGQRITLVAEEELNLYSKAAAGQLIGKAKLGEKLAVVRCEDLKHYIVPIVHIDGRNAYVVEGKFSLERKEAWKFGAGPLSFSC
jgi:hypothetical protein